MVSVHLMKLAPAVITVSFVILAGVAILSFARTEPQIPLPHAIENVTMPQAQPYRQLTTGSWNDRFPVWSPNGSMIAYMSDKDGAWSVWVMNVDGSNRRQLSRKGLMAMYPSWSPDSSSLVFWTFDGIETGFTIAKLDGTTNSVRDQRYTFPPRQAQWSPNGSYIMFLRSGESLQLTVYDVRQESIVFSIDVTGDLASATWATEDRIVYATEVDGKYELRWVSPPSGQGGLMPLHDGNYVAPSAGPGGRLAYYSDAVPEIRAETLQSFGGYNVWISDVFGNNATYQFMMTTAQYRGSELVPVPYVPGRLNLRSSPSWKPDGKAVVYVAEDTIFGYGIYLWDLTFWSTARLGPLEGNPQEPSWSPDGAYLAFSCKIGGNYHIWVMSTSGAGGPAVGGGY
jgi:dipeptidyl aminopeptidase/acylaminoacyl peptidase